MPSIAVIGAGGLGGPIALGLATFASKLVLCDPDKVELSNLHRQVQFAESDVGKYKVRCLARRLRGRNHKLTVEQFAEPLIAETASDILGNCDLVVDGTDSFDAKFLVNDWCVERNIPFVISSIAGSTGHIVVRQRDEQSCYRCLFERPPKHQVTCAGVGVLGPSCGIVAAHVVQLVNQIVNHQSPASLWSFPNIFEANSPRKLTPNHRPHCKACWTQRKQGTKMATIRIPTPLRKLTGGNETVNASGATVEEVLSNLETNYPGLKARICDDTGAVKRFVNIYIKDEDIRHLENLATKVAEGDEISIVPAIAGGN